MKAAVLNVFQHLRFRNAFGMTNSSEWLILSKLPRMHCIVEEMEET